MSAEDLPAELYQGCANAWECDEMGHLNVRFHVERALVGLGVLAERLAMPRAFAREANATIAPTRMHVRFLREARPGAPLFMRGGVVSHSAQEAEIFAELRHSDGAPSSTFSIQASHVDARTLKPFAWSSRTRAAFPALACVVPAHAKPRSIDLARAPAAIARAQAIEWGVAPTARSIVSPPECDAFGRMRGEMFIARVSDAVPFLLSGWRAEAAALAAQSGEAKQPGGAAVEFRINFRRWPQAGDHLEVRSAITEVMEKANRIVHWVLDPVSGEAWASIEAIAISFDLATRKAYAAPPELRAALAKRAVPQMKS